MKNFSLWEVIEQQENDRVFSDTMQEFESNTIPDDPEELTDVLRDILLTAY